MSDERELDPRFVAFMDQESKAFNEEADEFEATYGFKHECRCDQDYTSGRVGEVPECFIEMVALAMETCKDQKKELDIYRGLLGNPEGLHQ